MAYININTGGSDNDPNADKIRIAFNKAKSMFLELFGWQTTLESELNTFGSSDYINLPYDPIGDIEQLNVVNSINYSPFSFTVVRGQQMYVTSVIAKDGDEFLLLTYLLRASGIYGGGITFINNNSVIKINEDLTPAVTVINVGDIGMFNISAFVNSNSPIEILGLTVIESESSLTPTKYIFAGKHGLYGFGAMQTTMDNFINITTIPDL